MPVCLAGAKIVAEQIMEREGVSVPWKAYSPNNAEGGVQGGLGKLDQLEGGLVEDLWYYSWVIGAVLVLVIGVWMTFVG